MSQQQANLTVETIRHHVDTVTFGRGREYALGKRVTHARRAGDTLKADCIGSGEAVWQNKRLMRHNADEI